MNNNDIRSREELRQMLQQSAASGDTQAFLAAWDEMNQRIGLDLREEYEQRIQSLQQELDGRILAQRGVHQLTAEERTYYQRLGEAMKSTNPQQAVTGLDLALPKTVIDSVFEELQTAHPLLSRINFRATGGAYPEKAAIKVTDLSPATVGNLLSIMAADPNGKPRRVRDVIFLVNPQDYLQKVMPATTLMSPDGTYRNDVMPYPMDVIQTAALPRGKAIMGIAYRYLAMAGTSPEGRIEYSDHYRFLEDERVYLIKAYANGMPLDNNAFQVLDISGIQPATYKVTQVTAPTPSNDATLSALSIGSLALTPAFAKATVSYTATTTNATNTITAVPSDAAAALKVTVNDVEIDNGTAATWQTGSNTVKVMVTAPDGEATKTYTVTVTKS